MLAAPQGQGNIRPPSAAMGSTSSTSRCSGRGTANISSGRKSSTLSTSWWISTGQPPLPKSSRSSSGTRTRPRRYRQGMGPWGHVELGRGVMAWPAAGLGWEPMSDSLWDPPSLPWYQGCHHPATVHGETEARDGPMGQQHCQGLTLPWTVLAGRCHGAAVPGGRGFPPA